MTSEMPRRGCPYRKAHEFNPKDGLCDHCYAPCEHRTFNRYDAVTAIGTCALCGKNVPFADILAAATKPVMPLDLVDTAPYPTIP